MIRHSGSDGTVTGSAICRAGGHLSQVSEASWW